MADTDIRIRRAWELCYLDPLAARDIGHALTAGPAAAEGWLHVALGEVRMGDAALAQAALERARAAYADDPRGAALCDEVQAIALRRAGDFEGADALQRALDKRGGVERDAIHAFIAENSRAITAKLLGDVERALQHFYAACDAAERTGWPGPRATALSNLGGYHQDLYNFDDARELTEQGHAEACRAGAVQALFASGSNLIVIYHALGEPALARAQVDFLLARSGPGVAELRSRFVVPMALGHLAVGEHDAALGLLEAGAVGAVADGDGHAFWAWVKARCLLALGRPQDALAVADQALEDRRSRRLSDRPYDLMSLQRVRADAAEQAGDAVAALRYTREAHASYEQLVGRSARARRIALEVRHELAEAERERDTALAMQRTIEHERRRLAQLNAALQAQMVETEQLHARLREQALHDPLTGLHNRRYLFESGPGMLELARRQGAQLCAVLIDLDHFKQLNDSCGHQAGDLVLRRFATLLRGALRRSDLVCRYGGEEFVAVIPDVDAEGAYQMLGRLLETYIGMAPVEGDARVPPGTFSAGIALFPQHGDTLEQLLQRADLALYAAKGLGRARIEIASHSGHGQLN